MGIKTIAIMLHAISNVVAFVVSSVQTARIKKEIRKYNFPILVMFAIGGLLAGLGTYSLNKSMEKKTEELVRLIKNN